MDRVGLEVSVFWTLICKALAPICARIRCGPGEVRWVSGGSPILLAMLDLLPRVGDERCLCLPPVSPDKQSSLCPKPTQQTSKPGLCFLAHSNQQPQPCVQGSPDVFLAHAAPGWGSPCPLGDQGGPSP